MEGRLVNDHGQKEQGTREEKKKGQEEDWDPKARNQWESDQYWHVLRRLPCLRALEQ